jgi:three-Cys-motif partner protein
MPVAKKAHSQPQTEVLFEIPPLPKDTEVALKRLDRPVWTESKAKLIERYLYYFVLITRHGTYIDAFAGPQRAAHEDMWTAKLVLNLKPKWLKHFYLCDDDKKQVAALEELKERHVVDTSRYIEVYHGDCNTWLPSILPRIKQKEAVFCLLDQRTFECHWSTVEALARHKKADHNKIELFYFLPNAWFARARAGLRNEDVLRNWWGNEDYKGIHSMKGNALREAFTERFRKLGYRSVKPWPIYDKKDGRRIMYWMIHATDHPEAPKLMRRAYQKAVTPMESKEQLLLELKV